NEHLRVIVDVQRVLASISLKGTDLRWQFECNEDGDLSVSHGLTEETALLHEAVCRHVQRVKTPSEERVSLLLEGLPGNTGVTITYALEERAPCLRVEVEALPTGTTSRITQARFPGHLSWVDNEPRHTVWPNESGMLVPSDYPVAINPEGENLEARLGFNRELYQPWWGVVGKRGAYVAIAETGFDFALDLRHAAGGPTTIRPVWFSSLGQLGYPRAMRYVFFREGTHATLAKAYRTYAQSIGRWVSLSEKIERNAQVKRLIGCTAFPTTVLSHWKDRKPPVHQVLPFAKLTELIRRLKALGREKALIHVDGWGQRGHDNFQPDILPPCPEAGGWGGLVEMTRVASELGYMVWLHDQYRDYYLDGPRFTESRSIRDAKGALPLHNLWPGGAQVWLCAKESLANVRRNYTELLARGAQVNAAYLDVFAVAPLDECFDPTHPMSREDCYRWRAAALDYVRSLGIIVSSEEPTDCFIPHMDFCYWSHHPRTEFITGEYVGIPVPLHNLVYHDALLLPAAFDHLHSSRPELRAQNFLEGLSQVGFPYASINTGKPEDFGHTDILARLHEAWATHELKDHRLIEPEGLVQEFEYPEGLIAIDLREYRYRIEGGPVATKGWMKVEL
ncbi:MAG: DUF6259 domain-containing protein, partial [Armatimonadetes bacterium]|nr:DUF6259 domain-containing protein [Armatimonadota bacterium]